MSGNLINADPCLLNEVFVLLIGLILKGGEQRISGDAIQASAIRDYLSSLGVEVQVASSGRMPLAKWDYAILFNLGLTIEASLAADSCIRAGVPYIVFPVFWDLASVIPKDAAKALSFMLPATSARRRAVARLPSLSEELWTSRVHPAREWLFCLPDRQLMRHVLRHAFAICPNSLAEMTHLASYLGVTLDNRWTVVRNGVWSDSIPSGVPWDERVDEIVCLGGLSPRKNSLTLVEAARDLGVRLRIVGQREGRLDAYARKVVAAAGRNTSVEGPIKPDAAMKLLATAKVHAQVSYIETPGLASLEAIAAGASVVVSSTPVVREYLPYGAINVNPYSARRSIHRHG